MHFSFKFFCISIILVFIAWIAKMHFILGGDYLFRLGTLGIMISLLAQIAFFIKHAELKSDKLVKLFLANSIALLIAYAGMMLKVAHIMEDQLEKDFVLDFIGIPAILVSFMYNFIHIDKLMAISRAGKLIFFRHIMFPWTLFLFSFVLYALYSAILVRV